jgi:RHS repeat-associated protein
MGNVLTKTQYLNPSTTLTWSYTYNSFQEVLTATDPLGNVTTNVYDANGNLLSTSTPPPSGSGSGLTTTFQYNALGELTQVTDPKGNATHLAYTPAGLVASITDAQSNTTTFTYDGRGNRLTSVDALNNTTSYTYDVMNRLTRITAPDQTYTQFAYDNRGRRISVTDANGRTTAYQYDDADRLVAVTDAAQNSTVYGYDTENNMVGITDAASHQTAFAYDALGRVTQVTFPSTLSESYTYDAVSNLLSKTDRKNQTIQYGYDPLYRLATKTYPDSTAVNYTYDPLSRLTQVTDPTGTYSFTYDNLGRLLGTGTQYSFLSTPLNNSYGYDSASNRVSFSNPQSQITNYSYDSLNRLTTLTDSTTGHFGFGYDALNRRTSLTRPNGVGTSYSYDTLSRLLNVLHNGGSLPGSTSYTYDAAGNRLTKTAIQEASPNPVSVLSQYSYDPIYELTQAVVGGTLAESYSYDPVGNRLASAGPTSYNYNASNELTSSSAATYAYDNDGNTTSKTDTTGTTYYTWDYENRLTSVTLPGTGGTVNLKYDPFGRRIEKASPTATTVYAYDGDNVIEQLGGGGNLLAHYTQGARIDQPLAITDTGGTYFYHTDGLGSIASLTDSTGSVAASYVYDSFGKLTASTGTITNPFQYSGREFDSETGLYYYRARYYDPKGGRFLSEDPIGFDGGANFYAYAGNSPTLFTDPSGYVCCTPEKKKFFDWLNAPLAKMAADLDVSKTMLLTLASQEGGWSNPTPAQLKRDPTPRGLDYAMSLSNPFGFNRIANGKAVGDINYTQLAGGDSAKGLSLAIQAWEQKWGEAVEGYQTPEGFAFGLEHPVVGGKYNSANPDYERYLVNQAKTMEMYMKACGIQ